MSSQGKFLEFSVPILTIDRVSILVVLEHKVFAVYLLFKNIFTMAYIVLYMGGSKGLHVL